MGHEKSSLFIKDHFNKFALKVIFLFFVTRFIVYSDCSQQSSTQNNVRIRVLHVLRFPCLENDV